MVPVQRIEKGFDPRFSELVLPFVSDSACFRAALRFCLRHSNRSWFGSLSEHEISGKATLELEKPTAQPQK